MVENFSKQPSFLVHSFHNVLIDFIRWDAVAHRAVWTEGISSRPTCIDTSRDGTRIVVGTEAGTIVVIQVKLRFNIRLKRGWDLLDIYHLFILISELFYKFYLKQSIEYLN